MGLEISKILTISTAHIKQETGELLHNNNEANCKLPVYYKKDEYGCFVFCNKDYMKDAIQDQSYEEIPQDLWRCMVLARIFDCDYLCLDCDGTIVDGLQTYEW